MNKSMKEDMEFTKSTEKAWRSYDPGEFRSMDSKDFLKILEKW